MRRPAACLIALAVGIAVALTGCTAPSPAPEPTGEASSTPQTSSTPQPSGPSRFEPGAGAAGNRYVFDNAARQVAANPDARGREFIDALVAVGFDKSAMMLTVDETPQGYLAASISWSVKIGDECLVGQFFPKQTDPLTTTGDAQGTFSTVITKPIGTGACLIGNQRQIDW